MTFINVNKIIIMLFYLVFALILTAVVIPDSSIAQDTAPKSDITKSSPDTAPPESTPSGNIDQNAPAFSNPAQAQHAENLAYDAAMRDEKTIEALDNLSRAEQALNEAEKNGDEAQIAMARKQYEAAEDSAETRFSETTDALRSDISAMRSDGMGWGQIALESGVHPGVLGLGHSKQPASQEITAAGNQYKKTISRQFGDITSRNMQTGWSDRHDKASTHSGSKIHGRDKAVDRHSASNGKGFTGSAGHGKASKGNDHSNGRSK